MKKQKYLIPTTEVMQFMGSDRVCVDPLNPPGGGPVVPTSSGA